MLEGILEINGVVYRRDHYGRIASTVTRNSMSAPGGAVVLTFLDRGLVLRAGPGREAEPVYKDVLHMRWDMSLNDPKLAHLGISRKDLFLDPETGERTFLSMVLPHWEPPGGKGPSERHPVVEDAYVINGSLTGPQGTMGPGAYFWRPPQIPHGPFGTRFGCVMLIRFLGGRHVNIWSDGEADFDFDAPMIRSFRRS